MSRSIASRPSSGVMNTAPVVDEDALVQADERGHRARDPDQLVSAPEHGASCECSGHQFAHVVSQGIELARERSGRARGTVPCTHASDLERYDGRGGGRARDELCRPAADVDHQDRDLGGIELRRRSEISEPTLLLTVEHLGRDPRTSSPAERIRPLFACVTGGRGRGRPRPCHAVAIHHLAELRREPRWSASSPFPRDAPSGRRPVRGG